MFGEVGGWDYVLCDQNEWWYSTARRVVSRGNRLRRAPKPLVVTASNRLVNNSYTVTVEEDAKNGERTRREERSEEQ